MKKVMFLVVLFILLSSYVQATVINVPGDQPTIQGGINAAASFGDTVIVANGTYTGTGNYNIDFYGKKVVVKSAHGAAGCIIDCEQQGRGFFLNSEEGENSVIDGFTIKNGQADNGGGIYMKGASPVIKNCVFEDNHADSSGGAVCSYYYSSPSFTNCTFTSNSAGDDGGAVYSSSSSSSFTSCTFNSNSAGDDGGAVYSYSSSSSFTSCTFNSNSAGGSGGAVYSYSSSSSFTSCTFTSNSAGYDGGAVYSYSSYSSSSFTSCTFNSNSAGDDGGAVYSSSSSSSFTSCTFTSNVAENTRDGQWASGGAVYSNRRLALNNCVFVKNSADYGGAVRTSITSSSYSSTIHSCTFYDNLALEAGGGLYCKITSEQDIYLQIKNSIVRGNNAPAGAQIYETDKLADISYSNIEEGLGGLGNVDGDPLFVNAAGGDFHLQPGSPCIDSGTNVDAPDTDLDGNHRPQGNGYDMGAYEYHVTLSIDSFVATPASGQAPLDVSFICTAHDDTYTIVQYRWNFGDGSSVVMTTSNATSHRYTSLGVFHAVCEVVNSIGKCLSATLDVSVNDNIPPVADAGTNQIIPGNSVNLYGSGSADADGYIVSWTWALDNTDNPAYSQTVSGENVTVTGLQYGYYTVTLTVVDNSGGQDEDTIYLCVAASDKIYTQAERDQAYSDGYSDGQNACPLKEDVHGNKILDGPLLIENNGLLTIQ